MTKLISFTRYNNTLLYTSPRYSAMITEVIRKIANKPSEIFVLNFYDCLNDISYSDSYDDIEEAMTKVEFLIHRSLRSNDND